MAKKQDDLPGVEGPGAGIVSIPEIDRAIDKFVAARDTRMLLTLKEAEAKKALSDLMHAHEEEIGLNPDGYMVYRYDDLACTLKSGKEELKVKQLADVE